MACETTSSRPADDLLARATAVVTSTEANGGRARIVGGVAIALRCPSARPPGLLARDYSDLDIVTDRASAQTLSATLETNGYQPQVRFNALHGHTRLMFDNDRAGHVDVFVQDFVMCHRLPLDTRLKIHEQTVPLADLLLTKLQVARLTEKDVSDAAALLLDHRLTRDETGISVPYVTGLLGRDWGWWRTVTDNLAELSKHLPRSLPADHSAALRERIASLSEAIEQTPKTLRWRARARVGTRIPWREDPEDSVLRE